MQSNLLFYAFHIKICCFFLSFFAYFCFSFYLLLIYDICMYIVFANMIQYFVKYNIRRQCVNDFFVTSTLHLSVKVANLCL